MQGERQIYLLTEHVLADKRAEESQGQWEGPRPHKTLESFQDFGAL